MGVFSSSAPQKKEPQDALVEPVENDRAEPETGESRVWDQGVQGQQVREEGGAGAALNVYQVCGLKFFIRPGDQWVSDSWIS